MNQKPAVPRESIIIAPHSENCVMRGKKHGWSGLLDPKHPYYYGNFKAKIAKRGNNHIWYNVLCNDPDCPAVKAVHISVLQNV